MPLIRAGFDARGSQIPIAEGSSFDAADAGGVPAYWIAGADVSADRTLLYLHGGGYCIGSATSHRALVAALSVASDSRALSVDYRLAPEHPHPAALDDALSAYRFLLRSGVDPQRIVIAGDSAGGGLTMATLIALRDAGDPLPSGAVCLSPWVDLEGLGESMTTRAAHDPMITRGALLEYARDYLGALPPRTPLAAPMHADLTGLPPILIQVGTAETLFDDSTRLTDLLKGANVPVTLDVCEDMFHVFQFCVFLPEAKDAIDRIGSFIRSVVPAR
jgi:acetyl esterase/lipase